MNSINLLDEIRERLAASVSISNQVWNLTALPKEYAAIVVREFRDYGVAVEVPENVTINERFVNCRIYTKNISIEAVERHYLMLVCNVESLKYEFASVCAQFVDPGQNGEDRKKLIKNPLQWWDNWKNLFGNTISEKMSYSVIAEMLVLDELYKKDKTVEWTAVNVGSHDIESDTESFEVKSTIKRYGSTITISGQHQLNSKKRLQLYFCRMEKSKLGTSINDMIVALVANGYDKDKIEQQIEKLGFDYGSNIRNEKYKILERRKYEINDSFPKISEASFKENHIPNGIVQITYTVDLDGIQYENW